MYMMNRPIHVYFLAHPPFRKNVGGRISNTSAQRPQMWQSNFFALVTSSSFTLRILRKREREVFHLIVAFQSYFQMIPSVLALWPTVKSLIKSFVRASFSVTYNQPTLDTKYLPSNAIQVAVKCGVSQFQMFMLPGTTSPLTYAATSTAVSITGPGRGRLRLKTLGWLREYTVFIFHTVAYILFS